MFLIRTITGRALQWLIVLPLLMSTAAWSQTDEPVSRYDIHVNIRPEARNLSVDMKVTLPPAAAPRKSLQFMLLPNMGTPQVQLIAPKAADTLTVRALAAALLCGCTHIEERGCAQSPAEVAKIEMTIRGFFEALRRDDKVAFQRLTTRSFYSFDGGKRFAGGELLEVVRDTHARGLQLNWNIGPIDIHLGCNMAWTAWENSGSAGVSTNLRPVRWLESAVLVKNEGTWKIDFLHSSRAAPPEGNSN